MNVDQTRCPECGHTLFRAAGRHIRLIADGRELHATDLIYCDKCGWWRPVTGSDLDLLAILPRRLR